MFLFEEIKEKIAVSDITVPTQVRTPLPANVYIGQLHGQFHEERGLTPNPYRMILSGAIDEEKHFITWDKPLKFFKNKVTKIMIRESYEKIYELIIANLKLNFSHHLVTGVPGIGISHFSLYFLWRYITENRDVPILFEYGKDRIYFLSPSKSYITNRVKCTMLDYPYLVDFIGSNEPCEMIGLFTVVFSSPDPRRYKQMMKNLGRASRYVMPVWTWEELIQLNEIHKIPREIISQRFDLIGGVPRYIFDGQLKDIQSEITYALSLTSGDIAKHFFEQEFGMRDEAISYILIHLCPDPEDGYCTRKTL